MRSVAQPAWSWAQALSGVIPPLVSPLDGGGHPDEAAMARLVEHVLAGGASERMDVVSGQTEGDWVVVTGALQPGDTVEVKAPEPVTPTGGGGPFGG